MKKILFVLIILIIFSYLIYLIPIQRYYAEKSFSNYIEEQGITKENISSKKVIKNYKQDGYIIDVIYKDDPLYTYSYYHDFNRKNSKYNILCIIYNSENTSIDCTGEKVKYPPLD